jgi:hypothetical protein
MADWNNPLLTSTYTNFLAEVKARDTDLALQFDGTTTSNIPTNTIRWSSSAGRWQKWSGTAWGELTTTYALTGLSTTGAATIGTTLTVTGAATFLTIPSGPTANAGTSTTQLANTAFVATALAAKANLASPTFTGSVVLPTNTAVTSASQPVLTINSTAGSSWKSLLAFSSSGTRKWEIGVDVGANGDNNFYFYDNAAAAARALFSNTGYFKASHNGSYANLTATGTNHEFHAANAALLLRNTNATGGKWWFVGPDTSANNITVFNQNGLGMYMVDGANAWTGTSDERRKDIIEPISDALEKVSSLRAVIGKFKVDPVGTRRSFLIAQDVQAVLPEAVDVQGDPDGTLGLAYSDVIPLLVAALKESTTRIEDLEERLALLEAP